MPRLRLDNLHSAHAGPFSLMLAAGACLAVTGPSGAGKSLLLRMVADLDPHSGEAWLDGAPRSGMTAVGWRKQVSYAAAEAGWWHETAGAHFAVLPLEDAAWLGLPPDIFTRAVPLCSTGERQRLALLRTLAARPKVLLLDEPTGPLDPESTGRAETLLQTHLAGGAALVLVTHDPAQADRLGTVRMHMRAGRLHPA